MASDWLLLSRSLSHALRHEPWLYELELDEEGWVELEPLLAALRNQRPEWRQLAERDVVQLMESSDKRRLELREGRIRALYGHSTPHRLRRVPASPPALLYHGTSPQAAEIIMSDGLRPMRRQYVHLSADLTTAEKVGRRKSPEPVILVVEAGEAHEAGVVFYEGNEQVWLADGVPAAYIRRAS